MIVYGDKNGDTRGVSVPYDELSNSARAMFFASAGAFSAGELLQALRVRRGASSVSVCAEAGLRAMFFCGILMLPLGRAVAPGAAIGGGVWLFALGAVIAWFGLLLRWWSFLALGKYFTVVVKTSDDQPVVDSGPYRVLRHPSYTGLLLAFAGAGLMLGNWVSTVGAVGPTLIALLYRLRIEERALTTTLGDRYREFAASRARLIPYVW
ncbi:MAG: isoprenylcysteine carboxylmethyltransferase family protein [Dactylosporangium sp.]|nr:isoprenylcysteine carboxylmethyltransferase family protein [Dactylosporangium sp.]